MSESAPPDGPADESPTLGAVRPAPRAFGALLARLLLLATLTAFALTLASAIEGESTTVGLALPGALAALAGGLFVLVRGQAERDPWGWGCALAAGIPAGTVLATPPLVGLSVDGGLWVRSLILSVVAVLCAALILLALALALAPRLSARLGECPRAHRAATLLVMTFAALVLSLDATWVNVDPPPVWRGQATSSVHLAGRLPFSDALLWYGGASSVADGVNVSWAARRPAHTLLRAGELVLAGRSHQGSLVVQAGFCALAIAALVLVVWRTLSLASAIPVWVGLVSVAGAYVRSFQTECAGLTVSCVALACMLRGSHGREAWSRFAGYGFLGLAWLLRPGPLALLALPPVLEWARREPRRAARGILAGGVLGLVFLAGRASFAVVATPDAAENANAAVTIYGLAIGKRWNEARAKFNADDPARRGLSVKERAALQYRLAREAFVDDPWPALRMGAQNLWVGGRELLVRLPSQLWLEWGMRAELSWLCALLIVLPGSVYALVLLFRRARAVSLLLGGACLAGLASLPLVWGVAGWRGIMILVPFVLVFQSLAFSVRRLRSLADELDDATPRAPVVLYAACALGPLLVSVGTVSFVLGALAGRAPDDAVDVARDPCVFLGAAQVKPTLFGPLRVTPRDAARALRLAHVDIYGVDAVVSGIATPALLYARNVANRPHWMIVEGAEARGEGRLVIDEAERCENPYFRRAVRWRWAAPHE